MLRREDEGMDDLRLASIGTGIRIGRRARWNDPREEDAGFSGAASEENAMASCNTHNRHP